MGDARQADTLGQQDTCRDEGAGVLLSGRGVHKCFVTQDTRIEVLNGIDFDVDAGETMAVVGESGLGKSTLLHIMGTLDRPDSGRLWFRGEDVFSYGNSELAKFRNESVGFVFQFHHLLAEFSAIENTMMPTLINGMAKPDAKLLAEDMLVRVGLKDRLFHKVNKLSGGEQQRVALARALILKPAILLADEPTGNLDRKNSEQIHELLLALNRELNMTLVVVTHNLKLASYLSRQVTIVDGKLEEIR